VAQPEDPEDWKGIMTHSMDGNNTHWGVEETFAEAGLNASEDRGREPTARELDAMNSERSETAHERDARYYGPFGDRVVQVRIAGATARTYAYEVPRGTDLAIGDWVTLPGNVVSAHGGFGIVKSYGRDGYDGPLKSIVKKIDEPDELMIRMSVVKTKNQAADLYDEAVAAGWKPNDLLELATVGSDRLISKGAAG